MGERGLKVTYAPFFKHIFNPELHPGRLDRLLSSILGQRVTVRKVLPTERLLISEDSSLIINFSYHSIKPVYVIVLMDESPGQFHKFPSEYIHRSGFLFDTGLEMSSLLNFIYIPLDIFRGIYHNKLKESDVPPTELEAWMCFLSSDEPADILRITKAYPFFQELYQDILNFRFRPKELIAMYSEALRIMDENTVHYMIDETKAKLSRKDQELSQKDSELSAKKAALSQKDSELLQKNSEIEHLRMQLAKYEKQGS